MKCTTGKRRIEYRMAPAEHNLQEQHRQITARPCEHRTGRLEPRSRLREARAAPLHALCAPPRWLSTVPIFRERDHF